MHCKTTACVITMILLTACGAAVTGAPVVTAKGAATTTPSVIDAATARELRDVRDARIFAEARA